MTALQYRMNHEYTGILKQLCNALHACQNLLDTNTNHPIMQTLKKKAEDKNDKVVEDLELFEPALLYSCFSCKDLQAHCNCIYYMIKLGLGTDECQVTAEKPSAAVPHEILTLVGNQNANCMEEVDQRSSWKLKLSV